MKQKIFRITTVPISLRTLLKGQLKFMNQYFEIIAISSPGSDLIEIQRDQEIRTYSVKMSRKISPFNDIISIIKLIKLIRQEKPLIVHSHTPKAGLVSMVASYFTGVPYRLHTVAGLPLMETTGFKKKVLLWVEKLTYLLATKIYPNSYNLQKYILENKLVNKEKLKVLGNGSSNGINIKHFDPDTISKNMTIEIEHNLGICSEDFVFIFIGRIVKDKGVEELINAFQKLSNNYSNVKLLILGNFENKQDSVSGSTKVIIKTNSNIIYSGYQTDVRPFLKVSNVLVHPSYREGFPNVVMQAGAMDVPSIVTDINGSNEIIKNGENGLIIPVKNETILLEKMEYLYNNREVLLKLKRECRQMIISRYEQAFVWNEILKIYKSLN